MKAPDKIYVGIEDIGSGYVYNLSLDDNGEQEYIREDYLLELIEEEEKFWDDGEMIFRRLKKELNEI